MGQINSQQIEKVVVKEILLILKGVANYFLIGVEEVDGCEGCQEYF